MSDITNTKIPEVKAEVLTSDEWMRKIPEELVNMMPESAWISLSLEDKKEILRKNNLFEKYVVQEVVVPQPEVTGQTQPEVGVKPEVVVENATVDTKEFSQFSEQVDKAKKVEEEFNKEQLLPVEDKKRIEEETAKSANTQAGSTVKVFGYTVSQNTSQNAAKISEEGSVEDGKTWAATLLKKIFAIFG